MLPLSTPPSHVVGCDVGKTTITVFDTANGSCRELPNRKPDLRRLARGLGPDTLVVCEATGGYEARLLQVMVSAGVPVHRADARKAKMFIRSLGTLGKSDAIDARALARYGIERWTILPLWEQPDPLREELQALVLARVDLVRLLQAQNNRLAAPKSAHVAATWRALAVEIRRQMRAIEARISALVGAHPVLMREARLAQQIKGIGDVTANTLLALMPELGRMAGAQAASLAGVAPHPHESGRRVGYRKTRGGRPEVKRALFMAALSASRAAGPLRDFYERLVARGKKPIVAVTALMRKLIVILNARIRDQRLQTLAPQNQLS